MVLVPLFKKIQYKAYYKVQGVATRHALKGLALPRASHSGKIALLGSHRLHCKITVVPVF
jgi:hypothetical protein